MDASSKWVSAPLFCCHPNIIHIQDSHLAQAITPEHGCLEELSHCSMFECSDVIPMQEATQSTLTMLLYLCIYNTVPALLYSHYIVLLTGHILSSVITGHISLLLITLSLRGSVLAWHVFTIHFCDVSFNLNCE